METFICYFYSSHLSHSILEFNTHTRLNTKHTKMIAVGVQKQSVLNEDFSTRKTLSAPRFEPMTLRLRVFLAVL